MSDPVVYDKAKYHYDGDFPSDLDEDQALVHTGMYLGWLVERGLCSATFVEESGEAIARFMGREMTGPQLYDHWDGCLIGDMLGPEGNAFSQAYFDFDRGKYLKDYEDVLCRALPSLYHVADTWENYERIRARIDERYEAWRRQRTRKPWEFWRR